MSLAQHITEALVKSTPGDAMPVVLQKTDLSSKNKWHARQALHSLIRETMGSQSEADIWRQGSCFMFAIAMRRFLATKGIPVRIVTNEDISHFWIWVPKTGLFDSYGYVNSSASGMENFGKEDDDKVLAEMSEEFGLMSVYDPKDISALQSRLEQSYQKPIWDTRQFQ